MQELSRTRWVIMDGKTPIKFEELPPSHQKALGNRVRIKPIESVGYVLEKEGQAYEKAETATVHTVPTAAQALPAEKETNRNC